ncbi:MAG: CHAD domain-containing protein [Bacteroidales bacterium]|nr:CHAD domain-containing protein [Bacteroidales bacterium]
MQNNEVLKYFYIHKTNFENNLKIVAQTAPEEAIHDMRVSIKRLRLLYKFMDYCFDKQFKAVKKSKSLSKVFKSAANLRDIQIQTKLIEDIEEKLNIKLSEWIIRNNEKEKTEIERLKNYLKKYNYFKLEKQFVKSEHLLEVKLKETKADFNILINKYFNNRLEKIALLLNQDKIDYHKIRKRIKEPTYLTEIININTGNVPEKLILLKKLGKLLGDWHDIEVFIREKKLNTYKNIVNYLEEKQDSLIKDFNRYYTALINTY